MNPIVILIFRENINELRANKDGIVNILENNFQNDKRICRIAKNAGTVIANGSMEEIICEFKRVLLQGIEDDLLGEDEIRICAFPVDIENAISVGYDCDAYLPISTFPFE